MMDTTTARRQAKTQHIERPKADEGAGDVLLCAGDYPVAIIVLGPVSDRESIASFEGEVGLV
jgi:hypothetical protein